VKPRPIDWPKALVWVAIILGCFAFWTFVFSTAANAAPTPGQELADDTAEWIGQTMKVPPLYRELLRANEAPVLDGREMAGIVWCETPRATTLHPMIFDGWTRSAETGFIADDDYGAAMVVLHELVHREPETCVFDRFLAEGITQAITLDLFPAWCRKFFGVCNRLVSSTYHEEVTYIRHQSARAVGAGWKTRAARIWRRAFYLAERDARRAMIPPTRGGSA